MKLIATKILSILIILLALSVPAHSQSGFMGKRFNFYFNTRLSQSWTMANKNEQQGFFKFDPWWSAGMDVVFAKNQTLGLEYNFYNTKYPSAYDYYGDFSSKPTAFDDISVWGIGLNWKMFFQQKAPLGFYLQAKANYFNYTASGAKMITPQPDFSSKMYGAQVGCGKTYIFKNCITLSPNFLIGTAFGKGDLTTFKDELPNANGYTLADRKVRNMCYFNLSVEIGFIPF
jgi:hypothetical protein